MSTAHDKALEILEERDVNLTEEDVKEIERLCLCPSPTSLLLLDMSCLQGACV